MEVAIVFGTLGAAAVIGLFVWLFTYLLSPRPSTPTVFLQVTDPPKTASNIGRYYAAASQGATITDPKLGHRQFPGASFVVGPDGSSVLLPFATPYSGMIPSVLGKLPRQRSFSNTEGNNESPFSSSTSAVIRSRKARKARNARKARKQ